MEYKALIQKVMNDHSSALDGMVSRLDFESEKFPRGCLLERFCWEDETVDSFALIRFWSAVVLAMQITCHGRKEVSIVDIQCIESMHLTDEAMLFDQCKARDRAFQLKWIRLYERTIVHYMTLLRLAKAVTRVSTLVCTPPNPTALLGSPDALPDRRLASAESVARLPTPVLSGSPPCIEGMEDWQTNEWPILA